MITNITDTLKAYREEQLPEDAFLRAVLPYPAWHVPVEEHDKPLLWQLGEHQFVAAQSIEKCPDGSTTPCLKVSGRHLFRHLPSDCDGVVFDLATPAACVITRTDFDDAISHWLSVLDLEDALRNPQPGQHHLFLSHDWFALADANEVPLVEEAQPHQVVHLFTASDCMRNFLQRKPAERGCKLLQMTGSEIFAYLAALTNYDAIALHYGYDETELLGPHAPSLFAQGIDGRSSARLLPARTLAETELFLDFEDCSSQPRTRSHEVINNQNVIRCTGTVAARPRTWWFRITEPIDNPDDLGQGPSSILCAGLLADRLRRRLRFLSQERASAAETLRWANELEKMMIHGSIPRSAIRSPDGSRFLREFPIMASAEWIHSAQQQAKSHAHS